MRSSLVALRESSIGRPIYFISGFGATNSVSRSTLNHLGTWPLLDSTSSDFLALNLRFIFEYFQFRMEFFLKHPYCSAGVEDFRPFNQ